MLAGKTEEEKKNILDEYLASQKLNPSLSIRGMGGDTNFDFYGARTQAVADGGRIGFQEGGGIEQRLEKLGGDVSSAEQMLQGINKRLETAESSLGSGGGLGGLPGLPTGLTVTDNKTPTNTSMPENVFMGNANMNTFGLFNRPLPESMQPKLQNLEQPQAVQQAFPGIPDSRPMGLAAADGTISFVPNPVSPQQQMEQFNASQEKFSPEERVQNAQRSLLTREKKSQQQLDYIDRKL